MIKPWKQHALRALLLLAVCTLALQLSFFLRIALMTVLDPQSTTFQRSEFWRLLSEQGSVAWSQSWRDSEALGEPLKRAVIASEDAGFVDHAGIDWDALESAWQKNQRAAVQAEKQAQRSTARGAKKPVAPKLVGASTISQQLAKNLLLSGERTAPRKAQELVLTWMLETLLSKERLLTIYLNNVEWGEGVFGAQAAAEYYFRRDANRLSNEQAARLAVMLPAPKRFEKQPNSAYISARAATIVARMAAVELP
jgi:monofunctional glycosyltransferase